ncbi:hypothetical protein HPC49_33180 [Pyxidicoccus fallax]|uniref:Uncharacterized protein n=1 Tax=Pyxidicoccus fallax TaxID=394095 RepID=A0A848LLP1_9BACT|nr:hypothetical protein [Pyxidicoccus fallax]NMO18573.1 hypothetical protein [Pyxidicoccus fallax]NPC83062.1 hypothetical protein [Pyxidicoccus fallax]
MAYESDEQFLSQFPEGSSQREFHETMLGVIRSVPFPMTKRAGFALQWFLRYADVVIGDFDTRAHPAAGSNREDAELVSHVFAQVNPEPDWWLDWFRELSREELDEATFQLWREAFERRGRVLL